MNLLLLCAGLFLVLCHELLAAPVASHGPITCCPKYQKKPVPLKKVKTFYVINNSQCTKTHAVVFKMKKKGRQVCADPNSPWVKARLDHLPRS
ncbi:C-C motif chemokine 3-like 1 [Pleurodeles waltl]|uniref:C-C motif chemokine 3-like 1 n=1 Tax=Pleurodeles waltl TaxID=8319 RepID=UPI003709A52F